MTPDDRLWLGGWIALCLGIAHDNWVLRLLSVFAFVALIWQRRKRP